MRATQPAAVKCSLDFYPTTTGSPLYVVCLRTPFFLQADRTKLASFVSFVLAALASHPMLPHPRPQRDKAERRGGDRVALPQKRSQLPDCILGADARPPHALLCIPMPATLYGQKPDSLVNFGSPHWLRITGCPPR